MSRPVRWGRAEWEQATMDLLRRDGDCCPWCGKALQGQAERHHRQRRRDGGDHLANLVLLHPRCHNGGPGSVHGGPDHARARGFIVSFAADPLTQPIQVQTRHGQAWYSLDDRGSRQPYDLSLPVVT